MMFWTTFVPARSVLHQAEMRAGRTCLGMSGVAMDGDAVPAKLVRQEAVRAGPVPHSREED
jgi:hypothetical protein